jgi:hypothetical protein
MLNDKFSIQTHPFACGFAALGHPWFNSLPGAGRAAPLARPLWDEQDAQVANYERLAIIRGFLRFFLDLLSLYAKIANL